MHWPKQGIGAAVDESKNNPRTMKINFEFMEKPIGRPRKNDKFDVVCLVLDILLVCSEPFAIV
jgi:hypothetical protein